MLIDAENRSTFQDSLVQNKLNRENVINSSLQSTVFEIIDFLWLNESRISEITSANK